MCGESQWRVPLDPKKVVKNKFRLYVCCRCEKSKLRNENHWTDVVKTYLKPIIWAGIDAQKGIFKNQPQFWSKISMVLNVITFENRAVGSLWGCVFKIGSQCENYHITHTILHKNDGSQFKGWGFFNCGKRLTIGLKRKAEDVIGAKASKNDNGTQRHLSIVVGVSL